MKIVVIGGSGLMGSRVVRKLREQGNEAVSASRDTLARPDSKTGSASSS